MAARLSSGPHHQHAVEAREVLRDIDAGVGEGAAGEVAGGGALVLADLGEESAAGPQVGGGLGEEAVDEAKAVGAAVQAEAGLVLADLGWASLEVGGADVGEIGGDDV